MKRVWLTLLVVILFVLPAMAADLDSISPPFGEELSTLDNAEHFVKYMEKDGISYYNYIGPKKTDIIYDNTAPHIVYAFVQNKLYARILTVFDVDMEPDMAIITKRYGEPDKKYNDGQWSIFQWDLLNGDDVTLKMKYDSQTREMKCVKYYNPLRTLAKQLP